MRGVLAVGAVSAGVAAVDVSSRAVVVVSADGKKRRVEGGERGTENTDVR